MRTYNSVNQAWESSLRALLKKGEQIGSRNGDTLEMRGYSMRLTEKGVVRNVLLNPRRAISPAFMVAEFLWYMSGTANASMLFPYARQYKQYCEPGTSIAWGAYGPRMLGLFKILDHLRDKPDSRRAVLVLWQPQDMTKDNLDSRRDIPCTLDFQFFVRGGHVETHVSMRSQDVWVGMPYDLFAFSMIHRMAAEYLGMPAGPLYHQVTSLHLYARHKETAQEALRVPGPRIDLPDVSQEKITGSLGIEKRLRESYLLAEVYLREYLSPLTLPLLDFWSHECSDERLSDPRHMGPMIQAVEYWRRRHDRD